MIITILCGGLGTRLNNYSLPKPLNKILSRYAIEYVIEEIPKDIQIHFVYSSLLDEYNFKQIIINICKDRKISFYKLEYITRGALESAYIGTKNINTDDNIIFIDNDVINYYPDTFFYKKYNNAFIGCSNDYSESSAFSFVLYDNNKYIYNIKEKCRISNTYCCGVYGFINIEQFRNIAKDILSNIYTTELYMSVVYERLIEHQYKIECILMKDKGLHIGSLNEIIHYLPKLKVNSLRLCFDLDNTLVTYPNIPGDYTTVEPIVSMIDLLRSLYNSGHIIIIYTARRMATHKNNIGAVMKDIGKITFDTLDKFNIPYHEIIFGKPIADIYIDDRAVNPYINNMSIMGIIDNKNDIIINKLPNNKYNHITLNNNIIIKKGPSNIIDGEQYYYKTIQNMDISSYFPICYNTYNNNDIIYLELEYIKGISFYHLYKNELLTKNHIDLLLDFLDKLHNYKTNMINPSKQDIYDNYIIKLKKRFENIEDYSFNNSKQIQNKIIEQLEEYLRNDDNIIISNMIHGDFWFSNIYFEFNKGLKVFDMKGKCGAKYTLGGDILYDYGKLYQSILGFDFILYNDMFNKDYMNNIEAYFINKLIEKKINIYNLKIVTKSLIIGTIHFYKDNFIKNKIWNLVESLN